MRQCKRCGRVNGPHDRIGKIGDDWYCNPEPYYQRVDGDPLLGIKRKAVNVQPNCYRQTITEEWVRVHRNANKPFNKLKRRIKSWKLRK